jgi:hypothetical protein
MLVQKIWRRLCGILQLWPVSLSSSVLPGGEFTVIDYRSNGGGGECPSAEYLFRFKTVVVEANDVTYVA